MSDDSSAGDQAEITGGCGCGAVRWKLSEPPLGAAYCHCKRCQRRTGSGSSLSALAAPGSLEITAGEDLIEAWSPDDGWPKSFCSKCGSPAYGQHPERPDVYILRLGNFDDDPGVQVHYRQFFSSAASWDPVPDDGLPRFEGRPPTAP